MCSGCWTATSSRSAPRCSEVAERIIGRLTVGGGELLTLIVGADAEPDLVEQLRRRHPSPGLEIEVVDGGQRRYPLLIGIE